MTVELRKFLLDLKRLRLLLYVPFGVLLALLPVMCVSAISAYGGNLERAFGNVMAEKEQYLPLLAAWWMIFILKEYIDGEGLEILYTYSHRAKTAQVIGLFALYLVPVGILYGFYFAQFGDAFSLRLWHDLAKTVIQCIFFTGAAYMAVYTFKSTALCIMLLLIYNIFTVILIQSTYDENNPMLMLSIFTGYKTITLLDLVGRYSYVLIIGIIFFLMGVYKNKRFFDNYKEK